MSVAPRYTIKPLGKRHARGAFSCGNEALDKYLKKQAGQDARKNVAAPFALTKEKRPEVLGYYSLSAYGIFLEDLPEETIKKLPRYPIVPATLLGRLAVDINHQGTGLGEFLLMDALHRSLNQAHVIASVAVVVDVIDDAAFKFYSHFNFLEFRESSNRMFLPMKTIQKLF